jgi:hypothetical protein
VLQPVYEFYGAVMLDEHSRRNLSNRWVCSLGKAMHREQKLVLLGLDAMFLRLQFAEMNEASDLSAELRQITIFIDRKKSAGIPIVSYHDV